MLPFAYALRHLLRDPARFLQKAVGSALVVLLVLAAGAFNQGMDQVLSASGSARNVILLGAGSEESIERSEVAVQTEELAAGIAGVESFLGSPAVSGEVHYMGNLDFEGRPAVKALLRGLTPAALLVHREVRLLEGQWPQAGEVMIGRLAHRALGVPVEFLQLGATLSFEGQPLRVAGLFAAPGTVMESEVWFNRSDLMTLTRRDTLSCVMIRMQSESGFAAADLFSKQRLDLEVAAVRESDYYARLSSFYSPIRWMTWLTAALTAAGAVFGGLNLLYAAFAARIRELATLQAIGYARRHIFLSLVQESLVATLSGTLLAAFLAVFLLEGRTVNFSMGAFHLTMSPGVVLTGLLSGILLGLVGAVPPAWRCLRAPLPAALRS